MFRNIWLICLLLSIGTILFILVGSIEAPVVVDLWQAPVPWFRDFMADSIYEGDFIGASDLGVTAAIICFLVWLRRRKSQDHNRFLSNHDLRFIWLSSFLTAIVAVHGLKWVIARARPNRFFDMLGQDALNPENLASLTLPGFLPLIGPRGMGLNSFPSGHTASCTILLAFSYVLWPKNKAASFITGALVLALSGAMGAARSMAGMHWLSDSVASVFLTWSIIHLTWHKISKSNQVLK